MGSFGGLEMLLVGALIVLLFGAGWIPKMARKAGENKVHVERARAEFDKTKEAVNAPIKSVTDAVAKVDKTLNTKPADLLKKVTEPTAVTGATVAGEPDETTSSAATDSASTEPGPAGPQV